MSQTFELVVRNAMLVSGSGRRQVDLAVRHGRYAAIEPAGGLADAKGNAELDASGLAALPGLIDGHVHFRQPGLEHKEDWLTGSRAAVMGGVTTVLDMPNTLPPTAGVNEARAKIGLADARAYCDFGLIGLLGRQEQDLAGLVGSGLIAGLKVFLGPTTGDLAAPTDEQLLAGLAVARDAGLRVGFHAEDPALIAAAEATVRRAGRGDPLAHLAARPVAAEVEGIEHAARLLAESAAAGHILHLSSAEGLAAVLDWRSRGLNLTCEVSAHHCFLSADDYPRLGGLARCNPPIREPGQGARLLQALADGQIDVIASDHAPHAPTEKQAEDVWRVLPGINGVETSLPVFLTHGVNAGRLTLEQLVRAFAERPAQVWGLWPQKGTVRLGSDADLVLLDQAREGHIEGSRLHGKHGLTPFEGWATRGAAVATVVRGRIVMHEGRLLGEPGWGRPVSAGRRLEGSRAVSRAE